MLYEELSNTIVDSVIRVSRELGPGLLELPYHNALYYELKARGLRVNSDRPYRVSYRGEVVGEYFADLVVESRIVIEVKSVNGFSNEHIAQLINYLRISKCSLGFLVNFRPSKAVWKRIALSEG